MQKHLNLVDLVNSLLTSIYFLIANIGFDTVEHEPINFHNFSSLQGFNFHRAVVSAEVESSKELLAPFAGFVCCVPVDDACRAEYASCGRYPGVKAKLGEDWLARQELHVELALRRSARDGLDWLLHIDLDELFVSQTGNAAEHFAGVPADATTVAYLNHEGVPEPAAADLETNRFSAITLFRRN